MTDPLSVAASVVGIAIPALHSTRLLLDDLENLKDAPKTVKRLLDEVHSVDAALKAVEDTSGLNCPVKHRLSFASDASQLADNIA